MRCLWLLVCSGFALVAFVVTTPLVAQEAVDEVEARERKVIERFVAVLEQNPRRGTALDKVYAFHVERGSLDSAIAAYRDRAKDLSENSSPLPAAGEGRGSKSNGEPISAASAWMIVGLLESMRGQEAAALGAFEQAERLDAANALASYDLAQTLVAVGQTDKAIEAFDRAIARQPAQADLLDMFQALGRLHQRTARADKALEVWNRLERQFPNDERVQEQIAMTLLDEEAFDAALPRFEKLAQSTKDRSRQLAFRMEAAEIRVRLGQTDAALKEFEQLLGQLNPDHWLSREVRRRIETIYLRGDDRAGLADYYEAWLAQHPDDLEAVTRVAQVYTMIGRDTKAREWLEQGLKRAPSRKDLRRALIDRLIEANKFAEAVAHYEQLDRDEPHNSDTLRDWGRALLRDPARDDASRKLAAAAVWRKLIAARPNDALAASQVGDWMRHAEMTDAAIEQYRRAIRLAPEATQYREYLGEYLHSLQRPDEALAVWRPMAEEDRRTAANLARLAEVLAGFGYVPEAITHHAEACHLDPKDFTLQLKLADLLTRAERHDAALKQLAVVQSLAASDEEREAWLQRDLRALQAAGRLKERIAEASVALREVSGIASAQADDWHWLARAYEVDAQPRLAAQAVARASELAPRSIPILRTAARLHETQRQLLPAAEVTAQLATLDRRYRTEYLQKLATLERQLGRRDKALQAGRDLIAAAPDNPEIADFFAQLCFQLRSVDEGLNALRRSARVNSGDPLALVRLATALLERQRAAEAVDLLWRAFDKSPKLDDRLPIVQKLVEAHAATGQPTRVIERLTSLRRERSQRREMTLCLAEAYQALGNDTAAQKELESLLSEETRDPSLLARLCTLAEKRSDWITAANYQRQVWQMTQDKRDRYRLAQLLLKTDQSDEAVDLLTTESGERELTADVLKLLDGLYQNRKHVELLARLKPLRQRFPDSWELLYREGVVLAEDKPERAADFFEKILSLNRPEDEPSVARPRPVGRVVNPNSPQLPLVSRMRLTAQIRAATQRQSMSVMTTVQVPGGGVRRVVQPRLLMWSPDEYGEARLAAWGWLWSLATRRGQTEAFSQRLELLEQTEPMTRPLLVDLASALSFAPEPKHRLRVLRRLAQHSDSGVDEQVLYLQTLSTRHLPTSQVVNNRVEVIPAKPAPLSEAEVTELVALYRAIMHEPTVATMSVGLLATVLSELKLAKRDGEADELLALIEGTAASDAQIAALADLAAINLRFDATLRLLDRLIALREQEGPPTVASQRASTQTVTTASVGGFTRMVTVPVQTASGSVTVRSTPREVLIESLVKEKRWDDLFAVWERHLRLRSLDAASQLASSSSARGTVVYGFAETTIHGQRLQVMPWPGLFDWYDGRLLKGIESGFRSDGQADVPLRVFRERTAAENISRAERVLWMYALAHLTWWNGQRDAAAAELVRVTELVPERIDLRLNVAQLYENIEMPTDALQVVDAIVSDAPDVRLACEQRALRLAMRLNLTERAKVAAERLFLLPVPQQELLLLADQMLRLDMTEQAETVLGRAANTAQGDLRAMKLLMDVQLKKDRLDLAEQTALLLLGSLETKSRPAAPGQVQTVTTTASGQVMVVGSQASVNPPDGNSLRKAAYQVLHRSGRLAKLIEEVEMKLKETPTSETLIAQLVTYHTAAGNSQRLTELALMQAEVELHKPQNRHAAMLQCLTLGRNDLAIAHLKILIEREPAYFAARCTDTVFRFEDKQQLEPLAQLFEQTDWSRYDTHPQVFPKVVELLMARPSSRELGVKLFLKQWQSRPSNRLDMLHRFLNDDVWKLPEVAADLRRLVVPTDKAELSAQWSLFGRVLKREEEGTVQVTALGRILTCVAERGELDALAADIEAGMQRWPDWTAGRVLLALVDLRRNRIEAGRDTLEQMRPALAKHFANSPAHSWEVAQELARHDASLDVGIRYFEMVLRERGAGAWTSISTTPGRAVIKTLIDRGRRLDARRLLLELLPASVVGEPEAVPPPTANDLAVAHWIGRELRGIGFPLEAIRVYQTALSRSEGMAVAAYDPRVDLQGSLVIAFKELKLDSLTEHLAARGDAPPQLDLQLFVTEPTTPAIRLRTRWQPLFDEAASQPAVAAKLKKLLLAARIEHPADPVLLVLSAKIAFAANDREWVEESVADLVQFIDRYPLAEVPTEAAKSRAHRARVRDQMGLWLVARECFGDDRLENKGVKLAERASHAARQQTDPTLARAISEDWQSVAKVKSTSRKPNAGE